MPGTSGLSVVMDCAVVSPFFKERVTLPSPTALNRSPSAVKWAAKRAFLPHDEGLELYENFRLVGVKGEGEGFEGRLSGRDVITMLVVCMGAFHVMVVGLAAKQEAQKCRHWQHCILHC